MPLPYFWSPLYFQRKILLNINNEVQKQLFWYEQSLWMASILNNNKLYIWKSTASSSRFFYFINTVFWMKGLIFVPLILCIGKARITPIFLKHLEQNTQSPHCFWCIFIHVPLACIWTYSHLSFPLLPPSKTIHHFLFNNRSTPGKVLLLSSQRPPDLPGR